MIKTRPLLVHDRLMQSLPVRTHLAKPRPSMGRGSKVSDELVDKMKEMKSRGYESKDIAGMLGVGHTTVNRRLRGVK